MILPYRFRQSACWFLFVVGLTTGAHTVQAESLRVATYNLRNYLLADRVVSAKWRTNYPKPESEKSALRKVLLEADADVLFVQEIGEPEYLEELRIDLADEGLEYGHSAHLVAADSKRHVAMLSKLPPSLVEWHRDLNFAYFGEREQVKRGLLEVHFTLANGVQLACFGVHLKSRFSDVSEDPESSIRRVGEATAIRDRILARVDALDVESFIILGDFNDSPDSAVFRRFTKRGDRHFASLALAEDSRGERWTYLHNKSSTYSLVDGLIVSNELEPRLQSGRGVVVDLPEALVASDHRLVYLDLQY